jgi:hypothetical protein
MQKLTFTKQSILISFWDDSSEKWIDRDISEASLPITWYLAYDVYIEKDVTIRDIITILTPYAEQLNFVFIAYLSGMQMEDIFIELINSPAEEPDLKIDALCMLWVGQVKKEPTAEDPTLNTVATLLALEIIDEEDEDSEDELHIIYDITSNQLLDTPVVLDDFLEYYDDSKDSEESVFSGISGWKFFDFMKTILNELVLYSFTTNIIKRTDVSSEPIGTTELFRHLDDLDKVFKDKPTRQN